MSKLRKILIVDDEPEFIEIVREYLAHAGYSVDGSQNAFEAEKMINTHSYDVILSDIHMPGKSGLKMLEDLTATNKSLPPFLFVSGNADVAILEKATRLGAADVIQKPFTADDLIFALKRFESRSSDKILDLMVMIRSISGITLGDDKRPLVETRLLRRIRQLGLNSIDSYYDYFKSHRDIEVTELVSLITTHTTQFFRESGHFDYLFNDIFPKLLKENRQEICIWSAACSSGEECYSIAICYLDFLRAQGLARSKAPKLSVMGSDIDFNVVEQAKKGIYPRQGIERLSATLRETYFDLGSGALKGLVRVKDEVHGMCNFRQMNLIGRDFPKEKFDIIFLRNVLIYFKPDAIKQIVTSLGNNLNVDGSLILGHSESLTGLGLPFDVVGNSIYQLTANRNQRNLSVAAVNPVVELSAVKSKKSNEKTRVFIIDDSATIRAMLKKIFSSDDSFVVVGEAENPTLIGKPLSKDDIDVVTLDIHMPVQDGIGYLRSIQGKSHPPVVMLSSVSYEDGVDYMSCLELGAVDYVEKPSGRSLTSEGERIRRVVKAASVVRRGTDFGTSHNPSHGNGLVPKYKSNPHSKDLIAIGASTGGVDAIRVLLQALPKETPPIVIVQHIPELFSKTFADRMNQICPIKVSEAIHNEVLEPNHAYVAPGGKHMAVVAVSGTLRIALSDDAPVSRHKPSVDFLFDSLVPLAKTYQISAAILTGMGSDGARGMANLRSVGCHTIAQDEETCVVFGMPKVAIELGGIIETVPLQSIAYHILKPFKLAAA